MFLVVIDLQTTLDLVRDASPLIHILHCQAQQYNKVDVISNTLIINSDINIPVDINVLYIYTVLLLRTT